MSIESFSLLKAYITRLVLADVRIGRNGFFWGDSKVGLDAQRSDITYPKFHVEDVVFFGQGFNNNAQRMMIWQVDISIKGNAQPDDEKAKEFWFNHCHEIMWDLVLRILNEENQIVLFDLNRFRADMQESEEPDNLFGWDFSLVIGVDTGICEVKGCMYDSVALGPVFSGSPGKLSVTINGLEATFNWISPEGIDCPTTKDAQRYKNDLSLVLQNLVAVINSNAAYNVRAETDGCFLYLVALDDNPISLDLENAVNTHTWKNLFEI